MAPVTTLAARLARHWPGIAAVLSVLSVIGGCWWVIGSLTGRAEELRAAEGDLGSAHAILAQAATIELAARTAAPGEKVALRAAGRENAARLETVIERLRATVGADEVAPFVAQATRFRDALSTAADADIREPIARGGYVAWLRLGDQVASTRRDVAARARDAALRARIAMALILGACALLAGAIALRIWTRRGRRAQVGGQGMWDALTGLPNRRLFDQRVQSVVQDAERTSAEVSLILIDVDRFKRVNDISGHAAGDEVLVEISRRIANVARTVDTVARLGGDEFAWLLPGADSVRAWEAADRARRAIGEAMAAKGGVTISLGVCSLSDTGTATELVRCADRALYDAKRRGRDTAVCFVPDRSHLPVRDDNYFGGRDSA